MERREKNQLQIHVYVSHHTLCIPFTIFLFMHEYTLKCVHISSSIIFNDKIKHESSDNNMILN